MKNIDYKTQLLLAVFVSSLLLGNLLGSKVISFFGFVSSVGIFSYPLTFLITDIIEEVRGREVSKMFLHSGLIALCISALFVFISTNFPPAAFYQGNEAYKSVFSNSLRVILASIIAFLAAQSHDLWAFNFWKQKTGGKYLWLRNNLSTIFSQLIDSLVFMFIAFYHQTPEFTSYRIFQMILPYWAIKIFFALLDTPFVYLGVRWLAPEGKIDCKKKDKQENLAEKKNMLES
ncbi:MAG: queuosine precursor transporter [Methanosarcinaceae archaeon]|nr:queuosine precursor transporter [Methanosarcinaceae archaeon]MDD4748731.1 queuosine precursor transporter [Methanosarcinaceae archaeon]